MVIHLPEEGGFKTHTAVSITAALVAWLLQGSSASSVKSRAYLLFQVLSLRDAMCISPVPHSCCAKEAQCIRGN